MKYSLLLIPLFICVSMGLCQKDKAQAILVGGPCEGCEAVLEYTDFPLTSVDTLPGYFEGMHPLFISGTIFQADGQSPASEVILYVYHTNPAGIYPRKAGAKDWAARHGYIKTWLKTDSKGNYSFYTQMPGSYPSRDTPAHIHAILLEPSGRYYWISDYYFEGDPLLTDKELENSHPRGGKGILQLTKQGNIWLGKRYNIGEEYS